MYVLWCIVKWFLIKAHFKYLIWRIFQTGGQYKTFVNNHYSLIYWIKFCTYEKCYQLYCIVWHRGEPKVTVSPLSGCINLAVAEVDLGDSPPGSPIRLLKGSITPTGRRVWRHCAETYPPEQSLSLLSFSRCFSSCRLYSPKHLQEVHNLNRELVE